MITDLKHGDVLCIADNTKAGWFVRFRDKLPWMRSGVELSPGTFSHVAMVTHIDMQGVLWGLEGKPSRVEFVNLAKYLAMGTTISNRKQPKTDEQRRAVVKCMLELYAVKYDWAAIVSLGAATFGHPLMWMAQEWDELKPPKSVVCSSSLDAAYERSGLANPGGGVNTRLTTPDHWGDFILRNGWA